MIKLDYVITNGYISNETLVNRAVDGWTFVTTIPAKLVHPHAMDTDKVTIFSKYTSPYPNEINESPISVREDTK